MYSFSKGGFFMKEKWISELVEIAKKLPMVELKYLLWFARAFEKLVD